jgi:hypothetical protein
VLSPERALQGILAMLKPGGTCIGVVPCQHVPFFATEPQDARRDNTAPAVLALSGQGRRRPSQLL